MPHVSRDRVTAFTDAAVAIALTLLVLPLLDTVREAKDTPMHELLPAHADQFLAFALSFLVIARFWRVHRRLFDAVTHLDEGLVVLNVAWLFGIVFLPVPTAALVAGNGRAQGATALYAVNLLVVALAALSLAIWVVRHPGLWDEETDGRALELSVRRSIAACVVMAAVVPAALWLGQSALLLLLLLFPAQRLGERIGHRPTAKS